MMLPNMYYIFTAKMHCSRIFKFDLYLIKGIILTICLFCSFLSLHKSTCLDIILPSALAYSEQFSSDEDALLSQISVSARSHPYAHIRDFDSVFDGPSELLARKAASLSSSDFLLDLGRRSNHRMACGIVLLPCRLCVPAHLRLRGRRILDRLDRRASCSADAGRG